MALHRKSLEEDGKDEISFNIRILCSNMSAISDDIAIVHVPR